MAALVKHFEVEASSRARRDVLVDALASARSIELDAILAELKLDELKDICDAHGVDSSGRAKAPIVTRILGSMSARAATKKKTKPKTSSTPSPKASTPGSDLSASVQRELPLGRVDLSQLESHLWEAANILRGSPVDRTDWKSYILPLLFFKRICDVWNEERDDMLGQYGEVFADDFRFKIPDGCHWEAVRGVSKHVGKTIRAATRGIEQANPDKLLGVFGDASWTNKERLPDDLLKDLLEHFSKLPLGNRNVRNDVMGDAYEYLIKKFADSTNKKAGEFYTPRSVVRLMVDILDPKEGETIYDPACGTGGMLLAAVEHVQAAGGGPADLLRQALWAGEEPDHLWLLNIL